VPIELGPAVLRASYRIFSVYESAVTKDGKALSPVLLVRGDVTQDLPLVVADGYHRICASWYRDENIPIACRIVSLPS